MVGVFSDLRTDTLKVADAILGKLLFDILLKASEEAPLETFERLYRDALGKVLRSQFDRFEKVDVTGETEKVLEYAEKVFGQQAARQLKPDIDRHLESAFRQGQKIRYVDQAIQSAFTTEHKGAVGWLVGHDQFWIGKVFPDNLRDDFKSVITSGVKEGLGRKEIGKQLRTMMFGAPGVPGKRYLYDRVAATTVNRARNWGSIFSLEAAGFEEYTIRAVMDERTSHICRDLDGKMFRVAQAMSLVREIMSGSPEDLEKLAPWPRYDAKQNDHYLTIGGKKEYLKDKGTGWLQDHGISLPPFHGNCRSTYVVTRDQYQDLQEHPGRADPVISEKVPWFEPFTERELAGKTSQELRMLAREKEIKYFRVMNKKELLTVLTHPDRCEEIARIAKARWQKKPIPDPTGNITRLAAQFGKKPVRELMEIAKGKGIKNFRVMTKDQLVTVLSDPSKYDEIQRAIRKKLKEARLKGGKKPGTTLADDLELDDVVARKKEAIQTIASRAEAHGRLDQSQFERKLKKWLDDFELEHLEAAVRKRLNIEAWDKWRDVPWRGRSSGFAGIYWGSRSRLGLVSKTRNVFNHEMGHFLDDVYSATRGWGTGKIPSAVKKEIKKALREARKRAFNQLVKRRSEFEGINMIWEVDWENLWRVPDLNTVSAYGMKNEAEFWAECIEAYMKKGGRLIKKERKMYDIIKKMVFNGREFL